MPLSEEDRQESRYLLEREAREYKGQTEILTTSSRIDDFYRPGRTAYRCSKCRQEHSRHPTIDICQYAGKNDELREAQKSFPPTIAKIIYDNRPDLLLNAIKGNVVIGMRFDELNHLSWDYQDHITMMIKLERLEMIKILAEHGVFKTLSNERMEHYHNEAFQNIVRLAQKYWNPAVLEQHQKIAKEIQAILKKYTVTVLGLYDDEAKKTYSGLSAKEFNDKHCQIPTYDWDFCC
jgi:hypothetical protein